MGNSLTDNQIGKYFISIQNSNWSSSIELVMVINSLVFDLVIKLIDNW